MHLAIAGLLFLKGKARISRVGRRSRTSREKGKGQPLLAPPTLQLVGDPVRNTQPLRLPAGSDARRKAGDDYVSYEAAMDYVPDAGYLDGGPSAPLLAEGELGHWSTVP